MHGSYFESTSKIYAYHILESNHGHEIILKHKTQVIHSNATQVQS